jgi:hypothetical protein
MSESSNGGLASVGGVRLESSKERLFMFGASKIPCSQRQGHGRTLSILACLCSAVAVAGPLVPAFGGPQSDGFAELHERLGEAAPTGADIGVGVSEALNGGGNYAPNVSSDAFENQQILLMSGPSASSGHADVVCSRLVTRAPGIPTIWAWEALDWLQGGFLNFGGPLPQIPPAGLQVFNHSWVAGGVDASTGNNVMRRFDYQINRDDSFSSVGMNSGATDHLLATQYNGLSVSTPSQTQPDTPGGGADGPGRMKPDLVVASESASSFATPIASALAAILLETAATDPAVSKNPDADEPPVIKAAILAGCDHLDGWTNNPATDGPDRGATMRPLDEVFGAGYLNANRSHLILTAGEQDGATSVPVEVNAEARGWSRSAISSGSSRFWRFQITEQVDEVAILATWPRYVSSNLVTWNLMNVDLRLYRVDGVTLVPLVGDAGLPYFSSGNVVSESDVDNVELVVVRDLAPGEYVFEVKRQSGGNTMPIGIAWIMPETEAPPTNPADLNGDGQVNGIDLGILLINWGSGGAGDLNGDGQVNGSDLAQLLEAWGATGG